MALMMGHLYIALRSVDVSEDLARAAAEEVACYQVNRAQRWPGQRFDLSMWVLTAQTALNITAVVVIGIIVTTGGKP